MVYVNGFTEEEHLPAHSEIIFATVHKAQNCELWDFRFFFKELTCCFYKADTLLNEKWNRPVWGDHIHQGDSKIHALYGFRDTWTMLWSCFL